MNCKEKSDAQLYLEWSSGDQRAGGELSKRYLPVLLRFVRRRVRDPHTANDVVGATLLQLVRSRDSLKDPSQFRAFLLGIAWNTIKSHYRKQSHDRLRFVGDEDLDCGHPIMEDTGATRTLVRALARLPIEDQQILMSCYAEGMSYSELARAYGLDSVGTVASRLSTARSRLAEVMRSLVDEDEDSPGVGEDFTHWACQVRQALEESQLAAALPRKVRWWHMIEFETTGADSIRSAYRRWPHTPIIELEIRRAPGERGVVEHGSVSIGDRDWVLQLHRDREEYAVQAWLRDGRTLRLAHRPAREWKQVTRFAQTLDVGRIESQVARELFGASAPLGE